MTAVLQSFFACNSTLNGVEKFSLLWGVFKSGGDAPGDFVATKLIQNSAGYSDVEQERNSGLREGQYQDRG
jgi:hypothetical protein